MYLLPGGISLILMSNLQSQISAAPSFNKTMKYCLKLLTRTISIGFSWMSPLRSMILPVSKRTTQTLFFTRNGNEDVDGPAELLPYTRMEPRAAGDEATWIHSKPRTGQWMTWNSLSSWLVTTFHNCFGNIVSIPKSHSNESLLGLHLCCCQQQLLDSQYGSCLRGSPESRSDHWGDLGRATRYSWSVSPISQFAQQCLTGYYRHRYILQML